MFSLNSPFGACGECDGLGTKLEVDSKLVIPDYSLSLKEHAIAPWEPTSSQYYPELLKTVAKHYGISMTVPVSELPEDQLEKILYGSKDEKIRFRYTNEFGGTRDSDIYFEGVLSNVSRRYKYTSSDYVRDQMEKYMAQRPCPACDGYRFNEEPLAVKVTGVHIGKVDDLTIEEADCFFIHL